MKQIPLTQGQVALVDDEDYEMLNQYKWYAHKDRNTFYAVHAFPRIDGKRTWVKIQTLLRFKSPGCVVDHIDGNGLNNQRKNLRLISSRENQQNLHIKKTSGFPGVSYKKLEGKWEAGIRINGKRRHLGVFLKETDAAKTYKVYSKIIESSKGGIYVGCNCE